jgi:hypothetical protein
LRNKLVRDRRSVFRAFPGILIILQYSFHIGFLGFRKCDAVQCRFEVFQVELVAARRLYYLFVQALDLLAV